MWLYKYSFGLNISYSGRKYTEKDSVQLKVRHYPPQNIALTVMIYTDKDINKERVKYTYTSENVPAQMY